MDDRQFDRWTRALTERLPRRRVSTLTIASGILAALGWGRHEQPTEAKKRKSKKKKRRKKKNPTPSPTYSCSNLGTACGNTAVCQCRLDKSSRQVCMNVVTPPNGINFPPCQANANCGSGQFCDLQFSQCALACQN